MNKTNELTPNTPPLFPAFVGGGEVPESGDEKLQKSKVKGKQDLFAKGKSAPGKKK